MPYKTIEQLNLKNKRVLIRVDLNLPMENGSILDETRLLAVLPTIQYGHTQGAALILLSHLGRPVEGEFDSKFSLENIARRLSEVLKLPVRFEKNWLEGFDIKPGEIVFCENVRFNRGEKENSVELSKKMAKLCDVFIMDAFATAHRAEASTEGVAHYAKETAAGLLLNKELQALEKIFRNPKHPALAIVGGAKVSSKIFVLESLLEKVDTLIVGGGIANTFIAAEGYSVGASLFEPDYVQTARNLIEKARNLGKKIIIPVDVVVAKDLSNKNAAAKIEIKQVNNIAADDKIGDIGPETAKICSKTIESAATVIWNGPLGIFEFDSLAEGTKSIANAIENSKAFSVAGGGETIAAIEKFKVKDKISYISTGGGAFLEYLEGKILPAVKALQA